MPRVPTFSPQARARVGRGSSPLNTGRARLPGQALEQFGDELFSTSIKLKKLQQTQDSIEKDATISSYKRRLQGRLEELQDEKIVKGDGQDDLNAYEKAAEREERKLLNEFNKATGNKYTNELKETSNNLYTAMRTKSRVKAVEVRTSRISRLTEEASAARLDAVTNNPMSVVDVIVENTASIQTIYEEAGMSGSSLEQAAIKEEAGLLIETSIDSSLRKGEYAVANEILEDSEVKKFLGAEKRTELSRKMVTQARAQQSFEFTLDRERRQEEERIEKARQESKYQRLLKSVNEAEKAGDFQTVFNLQREVREVFEDLRIDKAQMLSVQGMTKDILQKQSKYSSYGLSKDFYSMEKPADLEKMKKRVTNLANAHKLTPDKAEDWERLITAYAERMENGDVSLIKTYRGFLDKFRTPPDMMQKLMEDLDSNEARIRIQKEQGMVDHYNRRTLIDKIEPQQALRETKELYLEGLEAVEAHPRFGAPRTPEALNKTLMEAKSILRNDPAGQRHFRKWYNRYRLAMTEQIELDKIRKDGAIPLPEGSMITPVDKNNDPIYNLFGIDDDLLTPESDDQIPPYLRRREY